MRGHVPGRNSSDETMCCSYQETSHGVGTSGGDVEQQEHNVASHEGDTVKGIGSGNLRAESGDLSHAREQ